jgi:uncharacterized protein YbjT (DUF2867 family)
MKVLIVGSSGMVGSKILEECLNSKKIKKIYIYNRKKENNNKNVFDISGQKNLPKLDLVFYCVGVYQNSVSQDEFIAVTYEYLKKFISKLSGDEIFSLLSAQGANLNSKILFAKWKGEAEKLILAKFKNYYFFRPAYIHPTKKAEKKRLLFYRFLYQFYPIIKRVFPSYVIELDTLGEKMVKISLSNKSKQKIYENIELNKNR